MEHTILAIIMENFSPFYSNEENALLSYADIRNFQNTWNVVDIHQPVPVRRVTFILRLLKGRLVVDPPKRHTFIQTHMLRVRKITHWRRFDIRKAPQLEELMAREEFEYIIEEEVAKQTIRTWLEGCLKKKSDQINSRTVL
ncbi:hypothetical protein JTB14_006776 [Gonioctena quinquepunctata]|nr:hypothetical protein JTB14_006776 [Gonioctena quinquepunctata]